MNLAAAQLDPTRADHGVETSIEAFQITLQHGGAHGVAHRIGFHLQPKLNVVAQGVAEQPWHLRGIRRARRHEEAIRLAHGHAIPQNLAAVFGQQPEQHPQQRSLARADATGNHHKLSTPQAQVDVFDTAAAAGIVIA